jgi:hypothetical protein
MREQLESGISKEKLKESLMGKGYDEVVLENLFDEIEKKNNRGFLGFRKVRFEVQPEYQPNIIVPEKEPKGLGQQVKEINEKVDMLTKVSVEKKNKHFELPRKITKQLKKLAEKNKVLVVLLKTNKKVEPIITDIKDGFISINGIPHNCSMDFVFLWKGKFPCIVLPEWDLNPIGTKDYYDAVRDKRTAEPIAVVMRMILSREALMKKGFDFKWTWIILLIIGVIAAAYIFLGGAK